MLTDSCSLSLQGQGQGEALPHQPGWPPLCARHLSLLREPGGAGELLREARTVSQDEAALPRHPRVAGALQHGRWPGSAFPMSSTASEPAASNSAQGMAGETQWVGESLCALGALR